ERADIERPESAICGVLEEWPPEEHRGYTEGSSGQRANHTQHDTLRENRAADVSFVTAGDAQQPEVVDLPSYADCERSPREEHDFQQSEHRDHADDGKRLGVSV